MAHVEHGEKMPNAVIDRIVAYEREGRYTQGEIAAICGVSKATVWRYLNGRRGNRDKTPVPPRKKVNGHGLPISEHKKKMIRQMWADPTNTMTGIAKAVKTSYSTVRKYTRDAPRRKERDMGIRESRCVVVTILGEEPVLMQPTGRMDYCSSYLGPERQWHFEALDTRDGRLKMLPMADIEKWVQPVNGAPPLMGIKLVKAG